MELFIKIFLFLISFTLFGENIDSLKAILKSNNDDAKFDVLIKLADEYRNNDAQKSLEYALESMSLVEGDSVKMFSAYRHVGDAYHRLGSYTNALENYQSALEISENLDLENDQFAIKTNLAYLLLDIKDLEHASTYFYENQLKLKDITNFNLRISFLTNFARFLEDSNNLDSGIIVRRESIRLSMDSNKYHYAVHNITNLANIFVIKNEIDSANKYYDLALKLVSKTNSRQARANLELNYGDYNRIQGNYLKAIELINLSREYFSKTEPEGLVEAYRLLNNIYDATGEKDSVIKYLSLYYELKDSLLIFESQAKLDELEIVKESELKDEIIKDHEESLALRERFYIAVGFLFFVLLILSVILLRNNTKEKKRSFELRKLNQTLDDTNNSLLAHEKELSSLNQTKDKFFSIIAHDLKNPVSAISSSIEFINNNIEHFEKDELKDFISDAAKQSKQLANLLNNLLTWSRSQRGLVEVQKEMIDIDTLMGLILGTCEGMASKKNIELVLDRGEISINSDKNLIDTIIRNLVSNSIKFTPENGKITVSSEFKNGNLLIHVQDTGTGIPEDKLNGLFSLDTNSSEDGTSGEKGTGLGLVLCQEFAEKLGGNMSVKSELGVGSTFTLTIPEE